ncbi:hypothetical protein NKJ72_03470 [Mesorhizobium sp. M0045]
MGRRIDGIARLDFRENAALHVARPRMVLGNDLHKNISGARRMDAAG